MDDKIKWFAKQIKHLYVICISQINSIENADIFKQTVKMYNRDAVCDIWHWESLQCKSNKSSYSNTQSALIGPLRHKQKISSETSMEQDCFGI